MTAPRSRFRPEYAIEAALLATFMISACGFVVLLEHPASPVRQMLPEPWLRRALMGLSMGATAVALIYSPWGKRSGAHMNPATTLAFARLGKVAPRDTALYAAAQFVGGLAGVLVASLILGDRLADRATNFAATMPGPSGAAVAFGAEVVITFILMWVILVVSNDPRRAHLTGLCAGGLVALYIALEAPLSGMSMNPARGPWPPRSSRATGPHSGSTSPRRRSACWPRPSSTCAAGVEDPSSAPSCVTRSRVSSASGRAGTLTRRRTFQPRTSGWNARACAHRPSAAGRLYRQRRPHTRDAGAHPIEA